MSTFDDKMELSGVYTGKCALCWVRLESADMRFDSF
jgi:hypothetical protein